MSGKAEYDALKLKVDAIEPDTKPLLPDFISGKKVDGAVFDDTAFDIEVEAVLKKLRAYAHQAADLNEEKGATSLTQTEIDGLQAEIDRLASRMELFSKASSPLRDNRKLHYTEAGQWARHFSTVRMTVMTFTITTCVAVTAWKWQKDGPQAESLVIPVGILWLVGVGVFWIFTYNTYDQIRRQQKKRPLLPSAFSDTLEPNECRFDGASLVVPILSCGYIWLIDQTDLSLKLLWEGIFVVFVAASVIVPFRIWHYFNANEVVREKIHKVVCKVAFFAILSAVLFFSGYALPYLLAYIFSE